MVKVNSNPLKFHFVILALIPAGTNISVYHTFRDEVDLYKTHWWRCDGTCKSRGPFFGFVKRTCNRAPGKNDRWWAQHQQTCGGTFIKVKEPEKAVKKSKNKENSAKVPAAKKPKTTPKKILNSPMMSPGADIRKFFKPADKLETPVKEQKAVNLPTSGGNVLGGASAGRSRLLDLFETKKTENKEIKKRKLPDDFPSTSTSLIVIDDFLPYQSFHDTIMPDFDVDDEIIFIDDEFNDNLSQPPLKTEPTTSNATCNCPVCNVKIEMSKVNEHLDQCLGC